MSNTFDPVGLGNLATGQGQGGATGAGAMQPADTEGQVRAIAIRIGLDPDRVWSAWQAHPPQGGTVNVPLAVSEELVRKLKVHDKLADSALVSFFTSKGVDKDLAVKALKKVGLGRIGQNPADVARVLTTYAGQAGSTEAKKVTTYLTSDQAAAGGVTQPAAGIHNAAGGGFTPSGTVLNGGVDDAFLAALKSQAKNFLTKDQIGYLGSTGSPDAFLNAIAGPGGSDQAALAMNQLARSTGGASGVPYEGDITASQTQVQLSAPDTSDNPDAMIPAGSRVPKSKWIDPNQPLHGGKTVAEAVRLLRDMPQDQLTNLQRKLVDAGYIARVASGSTYEPESWGDPTDPLTNAAWRQLLTDSIAQGTDVQQLLSDRTATFSPKLAELQAAKTKADRDKALQNALMNQVQVTSMDSLRSAMRKISNHGQLLGHDLNPDEVTSMGEWIQGLQSSQQLAEKHGSSWVPQVDVAASLEQRAIAEHPVDYLGQQTAVAAESWARLLRSPGAA